MDEADYKRIEEGSNDPSYGAFFAIVLVIVVLIVLL